jgi:hypothetical protein
MLDAMPRIRSRVLRGGGLEGVQGQVDGAVADRVRGYPPAGPVRGHDRRGQLGRVGLQVAAVALLANLGLANLGLANLGLAVLGLAGVGGGHRRGAADQRAVGEDLHRAQPQPVVAESGAQPEVEPEVHPVAWMSAE